MNFRRVGNFVLSVPALYQLKSNLMSSAVIQSNPAISNSVNSKSPLFRRKIEFPWIYPSPLRFPGYFETPLFRPFFHFPWDFEIAGFDCINVAWGAKTKLKQFDRRFTKMCTLIWLDSTKTFRFWASFIFSLSFHFSRGQNRKSHSSPRRLQIRGDGWNSMLITLKLWCTV